MTKARKTNKQQQRLLVLEKELKLAKDSIARLRRLIKILKSRK